MSRSTGEEPTADEIGFSQTDEKQMLNNFRELSNVAGNIFSLSNETRSVYFTSCFRGEGKTTAVKNCGYALSQHAHNRVLLVDAYNGNSPGLSKTTGLEGEKGFTDVVFNGMPIEKTIQKTRHNRLDIIPYGTIRNEKFTLGLKDKIKNSLICLNDRYDYVIIDGDSIHGSSEVELISSCFNSIIIVLECERTKWEVLQMAKTKIGVSGGNLLGVVLNKRKYYIPNFLYGKI